MDKVLFSFGHGYSAAGLASRLIPDGWRIFGTTRSAQKADRLATQGITPLIFGQDDISEALGQATHVLSSAGPTEEGDPVIAQYKEAITDIAPRLEWVGYLSTIGVYGDHQGGWVDETTPVDPKTKRGIARIEAEQEWQAIPDLPLHIFRLAGIYGPGRGPFAKLRSGKAQRIVKPNQYFSRIHVDDIANVLMASIKRPRSGAVYNLCDDEPAPPQDVIECAARLLDMPVPPAIRIEDADLSPMARSFYADSKRVRNDLIKSELGVVLKYPRYEAALKAILLAESLDNGG
jgi:nucleoside-diphosphate-sugar epimerase